MIRKDRYNYTSAHLSRNSRLSTGSIFKRREQCAARFWRKTWVPLLLGGFLAACDTGGAGGVQTTEPKAGGVQTIKPKAGGVQTTEPKGGAVQTTKPKAWYVETFAGGGAEDEDGTGTAAGFGTPYGIVTIGDTFYVTDEKRHSIRTININTAKVETLVPANDEGGHEDDSAESARFNKPRGAAAGADGKLYIADHSNHRIRVIDLTSTEKTVKTIAGNGKNSKVEHDVPGKDAEFNGPSGLAVKGDTLYVVDTFNNRIRSIDLNEGNNYTVKTIAGNGAEFNRPSGLAVIGDKLYVADYGSKRIRSVDLGDPDYTVNTINTFIEGPGGLAATGDTLYFTEKDKNRIGMMDTTTSEIEYIAGSVDQGTKNGIGTIAQFDKPLFMAETGGKLYVTTTAGLIRELEYRQVD